MTYMRRYNGRSSGNGHATSSLGGISETLTGIVGTVANTIGGLVSGGTESFLKLAKPNYKVVGGVAKATDATTLDLFKAVQGQLNRVAKIKGIKTIALDGAIGTDTKNLVTAVIQAAAADYNAWSKIYTSDQLARIVSLIATPTTTPDEIAASSLSLYSNTKAYADRLSAPPAVASPPPASPPTYIDISSNKEVGQGMAASASDAWQRLGTGTQIATIGALGVAGFYFWREHKKGSRRSSRR